MALANAQEVLAKVAASLDNTIRGKEGLLAELQVQAQLVVSLDATGLQIAIKYLKINIEELRRIRADLTI